MTVNSSFAVNRHCSVLLKYLDDLPCELLRKQGSDNQEFHLISERSEVSLCCEPEDENRISALPSHAPASA